MNSVLSYPDRGPWGDSRYRGNCSGYIFRDLFTQLRPKSMCDCMMGSGTSIEVAEEMGIKATGLDLRLGFNALRDPILAALGGEHVDLVVSHPPYGPMVAYSNGVWGSEAHPDDLSHAVDEEDFHSKMQVVMMNQRDATRPGGHYATIIGDLRSKGRYVSYQAEICARMPADELAASRPPATASRPAAAGTGLIRLATSAQAVASLTAAPACTAARSGPL